MKEDTLVQSVKKAMTILDILIFEDYQHLGMGLFDLAKKLDQKPNTLHNLLKTLISCGYVEQNSHSKYIAGPKCMEVGVLNSLVSNSSKKEKIDGVLKELSNVICEAVVFAVLTNGNRRLLARIEYDNPIKVDLASLESEHIYEKETGRVLAAYADSYSLSVIKEKWGYPGEKWNGIEDNKTFDEVLSEIRKNGHVLNARSDHTIISFAVPVLDSKGKLMGAIGSYVPFFRCDAEKQNMILLELKKTATEIVKIVEIM